MTEKQKHQYRSKRIYRNLQKGELENQRQDIVEGFLLRSWANWHENGERCSEYFCKLEKKSSINKTI
jgi:hypothetical protein